MLGAVLDRDAGTASLFGTGERQGSRGMLSLRIGLAIVFFWFGGIKLWPATPAEPIVKTTVFFLPHPEFFWTLGSWEAIVGLMLLSKRTIRYAAWLLVFQMVGTQTTLLFYPEATWIAWGVPSDLGVYVLKNWILVSGMLVVAVYYTGYEMREPPTERLESPILVWVVSKAYWLVTEWLPRNVMIFLRSMTSLFLVVFGLLLVFGHGEAVTQVGDGFAALGIEVADSRLFLVMGLLKVVSGLTLLVDELVEVSLVAFTLYLVLGLFPMFVIPEQAFFRDWTWIAPGFFTLYFLKDLVVFGAIYAIRDTTKGIATVGAWGPYWDPLGFVDMFREFCHDAFELALFWSGLRTGE